MDHSDRYEVGVIEYFNYEVNSFLTDELPMNDFKITLMSINIDNLLNLTRPSEYFNIKDKSYGILDKQTKDTIDTFILSNIISYVVNIPLGYRDNVLYFEEMFETLITEYRLNNITKCNQDEYDEFNNENRINDYFNVIDNHVEHALITWSNNCVNGNHVDRLMDLRNIDNYYIVCNILCELNKSNPSIKIMIKKVMKRVNNEPGRT